MIISVSIDRQRFSVFNGLDEKKHLLIVSHCDKEIVFFADVYNAWLLIEIHD